MSRKPGLILLKFGSGILTQARANALDTKQFARLTAEVAQLVHGGCKCIIVSSGAVAAGMRVVGWRGVQPALTTGQPGVAGGKSRLLHLSAWRLANNRLNVRRFS